ncbi:MAG: OmpP1/FadL family transporter [Kiritimatiellia bacterium]
MHNDSRAAMIALCGALVCGALVRADGFRNPPDTAAAIGVAGNNRAWVDDASAVFFNPANLADLTNRQVLISGTVGYGETQYRSLAGTTTGTELPWFALPSMAIAWPLPADGLGLGLGVNVPFGRQSSWDKNGYFRANSPTYTKMMVLNINPSLAWRASDEFSVGVGLDIYYGRLQFRQYLPWPAIVGGGEGLAQAASDGWACGANAGITWRPTPDQRVALTCRTPFNLHFSGDLTVRDIPPPLSPVVVPESDFSTTFQFPTIVALGYGIRVADTLTLEADVEWLQSSRFKKMTLDAGANNWLLQQNNEASMPTDWNNNWTFGLGAVWQFAPQWTLRGGYEYLQSPAPNRTFTPSILDNSQSFVTLGLGFRSGPHAVDLAGGLGIFGGRTVRNNQVSSYNGDYDFSASLVALTYTLNF